MDRIDKILGDVYTLTLAEAEELDQYLHGYIAHLQKKKGEHQTTEKGSPDKVTYSQGGWTYQRKWVKCEKPNCKCARGEKHGPYLYRAKYEDGKTKWEYVGKV